MRAIFTIAFLAGALAAGSAEACRSSDFQRKLLFTSMPPLERGDELVLDVKIRRVACRKVCYAWAEVRGARHGTYARRDVRIQLARTTCGPRPRVGDQGLLVGRLEVMGDGRPAVLPRTETNRERRLREQREGEGTR